MVRPEDDPPTDTPLGTTVPVGDRVKAVRIPIAAFPDFGITHVMFARGSCCDTMVANDADDIAYVIGLPPNVYEMVYPVGEYPVTVPTTVAGDNVSPSRRIQCRQHPSQTPAKNATRTTAVIFQCMFMVWYMYYTCIEIISKY